MSLSCEGGFKVTFLEEKQSTSFVGQTLVKLSPPDWRVKSARFKSDPPGPACHHWEMNQEAAAFETHLDSETSITF